MRPSTITPDQSWSPSASSRPHRGGLTRCLLRLHSRSAHPRRSRHAGRRSDLTRRRWGRGCGRRVQGVRISRCEKTVKNSCPAAVIAGARRAPQARRRGRERLHSRPMRGGMGRRKRKRKRRRRLRAAAPGSSRAVWSCLERILSRVCADARRRQRNQSNVCS
jgi:hypothetical protein